MNRAWRFGEGPQAMALMSAYNNVFNHVYISRFGTMVGSSNPASPQPLSGTRTVTLNLRFNF